MKFLLLPLVLLLLSTTLACKCDLPGRPPVPVRFYCKNGTTTGVNLSYDLSASTLLVSATKPVDGVVVPVENLSIFLYINSSCTGRFHTNSEGIVSILLTSPGLYIIEGGDAKISFVSNTTEHNYPPNTTKKNTTGKIQTEGSNSTGDGSDTVGQIQNESKDHRSDFEKPAADSITSPFLILCALLFVAIFIFFVFKRTHVK